MGLEVATYIQSLVSTNPVGASDGLNTADDHLRLIKAVLKATFPHATAAINPTVTEFNYLVGVTSAIQTQLNAKLASASYTAADVLTKLKTVDGAGSGLDADLLDGISSAGYMQIGDTATLAVGLSGNTGSAPSYAARAWVNFDGATGALNGAKNVTSVTRSSTGLYQVNFTTAMPSAVYVVLATAQHVAGNFIVAAQEAQQAQIGKTSAHCGIHCTNSGGPIDPTTVNVVIFA